VIRPEDIVFGPPGSGILTGTVTSLIFKGVHYEIKVNAGGYDWLIHSTRMAEVGTQVDLKVDPFDIQVMNKPASEDEEAIGVEE
jgi:spermidine/putrescine transport system ATP-binding protein